MVSSSSSLSPSSLSSSFNVTMNTTASSSSSSAAAAATGASASCTISRECQKAHQSTATTTIATQQQNQKRRRHKHLYAQKLNNSAASCMEIGQYDRAISSLSKALQLSEQQEGNEEGEEMMTPMCFCYHCSVDGCIEYSEKNNSHTMTKDEPFVCAAVAGETITDDDADADADADADSSYIYRRPIQVTPRSIQEGHNMGSSLCLIISFNLALAYHLKAITIMKKKSNNKNSRQHQKYLTVALKLYTHVIRWQTRLICQNYNDLNSNMSSTAVSFHNIRFKMILLNNMSQIHRYDNIITCTTDNKVRKHKHNHHEKSYTMCLELLLSQIMLVVEYKTRIASTSSSSLPYIMIADLEQFLQNTSPVLMGGSNSRKKNSIGDGVQDQCASAA